MPRKRRRLKVRRVPETLAAITKLELSSWRTFGPLLESDGIGPIDGYVIWPDWQTWAAFYAGVRADLYLDRRWLLERSAAERLYAAVVAGLDAEAVRDHLATERAAADPRPVLTGGR